MEERVSAQMKKWVCRISGTGRVTSLLMLDAACVVLIVWMSSVVEPRAIWGRPVQEVMVCTATPSNRARRR